MVIDNKKKTGLFDLDAMLHIVASVQYKSGNRNNISAVKQHVRRFINTVRKNAKCKEYLMFYQGLGHSNFRNDLLPSYKGHRTKSDAIKQFKSAVLDGFKEAGGIELQHLESDDATSIMAHHLGMDNVVIISSDKDMKQVPCIHYDPFKKGKIMDLSRWYASSPSFADKFFWMQVLAGDSTDMPNALCGIEGVGMDTAAKKIGKRKDYFKVVQEEYTKKYGKAGFERALVTLRMVRLLDGSKKDSYANTKALQESEHIREIYKSHLVPLNDHASDLFGRESLVNLFKS